MANNPSSEKQPPLPPANVGLGDPNAAPQTPYKFNADEMRVLQECNRESFFHRSLPLSTIFAIGTYYGVQSGYLKPNPRWGPTPKVMLAVAVGYFMGKVSYQKICAEKLMALPNSPFGEMLRKRKYGSTYDRMSGESHFPTANTITSYSAKDTYSDHAPPRYDLDSDRPHQKGLDDSFRPSVDQDSIITEELPSAVPTQSTTYEELRARNRLEYEQKRSKAYRGVMNTDEIPSTVRRMSEQSNESSKLKKENKYGDVWED